MCKLYGVVVCGVLKNYWKFLDNFIYQPSYIVLI
jgi:hypothetical protein